MIITPEFMAAEVAYRAERITADFRASRTRRLARAFAALKGSSS